MDAPEMIGTAEVVPAKRQPFGSKAKPVKPPDHKSEKDFMAGVLARAKRLGWRTYHTHDSRKSAAGYPDLTLVHLAHGLIFAELKVPPNKPTAAQSAWLDELRATGARAFLWYPKDWEQIEQALKGGK